MRRFAIYCIPVLATTIAVGCSSSRSTMLTRNECNTGWNKIAHLHGTPITLRVPTHLRVYVYEKHYLENVNIAGVSRWQRVELPCVRDFGSETLYTDKIFTTDFIRPAAGAFNLKVNYTPDQYIGNVQQDITDETLKQIGDLVSKIPALFVPQVPGMNASDAPNQGGTELREIKSVVAANIFEIDDPNFESSVMEFVQTYLNHSQTHIANIPAIQAINSQQTHSMEYAVPAN